MALIKQNTTGNTEFENNLFTSEKDVNPEKVLANLYNKKVFSDVEEYNTFIDKWLGMHIDDDFMYFDISAKNKTKSNTLMNRYMNQFVDDLDYGSNAILDMSDDMKIMNNEEIRKIRSELNSPLPKLGRKRKIENTDLCNKKKNA